MPEAPVALITGAGRGIGQAIAWAFSDAGYDVALLSRTRAELEETAERCVTEALVLSCDVTDAAALADAVEAAVAGLGRLDVVVNNAGFAPLLPITDTDDATLRRTLDSNLTAAFVASRAAWPHLQRRGGVIVNLSSQAARDPFTPFAAYAAAKAGLNGLTLALSREGGPHGIRCYAVAPGAVETTMFRGLVDEATVPTDQTLEPDDVAALVLSCVDGPLRHANGECIYVRR